jgi:hypothetical protein
MPKYLLKSYLLVLGLLVCFGCRKEKNKPVPISEKEVKLTKVTTSDGAYRQFTYNAGGQLTHIKGIKLLSLDDGFESVSQVVYDAQGLLVQLNIDGQYIDIKTIYQYTPQKRLSRMESYISDVLYSYDTFEYNGAGKLIVRYSYLESLNSSDFWATHKFTYSYDNRGNLRVLTRYHKPMPSSNWEEALLSQYEDYDENPSVEHLAGYQWLPGVRLYHNNPSKVTTTHKPNGSPMSATYTYAYNEYHYPVKKVSTANNGNSFETRYEYE